jgi:3-hydroxyacyl-CoA dehydrogenase
MYDDSKNPMPLLVNMVRAGKTRRKIRRGFYDYSESKGGKNFETIYLV